MKQSFPESVIGGFKAFTEENGTVLVDATDFFTRDAHGVAEQLSHPQPATGPPTQGNYSEDVSRSAIEPEATKVFPKNTEVETILIFTCDAPGSAKLPQQVTTDAHAVTVREHQSFVEVPGPGFMPRPSIRARATFRWCIAITQYRWEERSISSSSFVIGW